MKTVTAEGKRVARLTNGEGGPARGGVGSGRSWRSQRGTARRRWWPESAGPRAHAGELVGGELHGVLMSRLVQGIEEQLTLELGLRSSAVGGSPATVDWLL
jgi:hypothetical protein